MTNGSVATVLAATTHQPSVLESRIFGTLGVAIAVLVVIGYCYFEVRMRRDRRRKQREPREDQP